MWQFSILLATGTISLLFRNFVGPQKVSFVRSVVRTTFNKMLRKRCHFERRKQKTKLMATNQQVKHLLKPIHIILPNVNMNKSHNRCDFNFIAKYRTNRKSEIFRFSIYIYVYLHVFRADIHFPCFCWRTYLLFQAKIDNAIKYRFTYTINTLHMHMPHTHSLTHTQRQALVHCVRCHRHTRVRMFIF